MDTTFSVIALVISLISGAFSFYTFIDNKIHDRKNATLEAYNRLQTEVLDDLNLITKKQIEEICMNTKDVEYKNIGKQIARIEHFCVGINSKIYDIDILKRLAGRYFISTYERIEPIIQKKRQINKQDKHYDEFEKTVTQLKKMYTSKK